MGSAAAGTGAAIGTGAFTSVEADRTVSVKTTSDSGALLRFDATNNNANAAYAEVNNDGTVTVDLDKVNIDSLTRIFDIFTIENQGTQPAIVYAQPDSLKDDDAFDASVDNLYLDPQFSDMPNDDDGSLGTLSDGTTKYGSLSGIGGSVDDFEEDLFANNSKVSYSPDTFLLGSGQSFDFGLYIKAQGQVSDVDIDMTIEADAALADKI